MNVNIWLYYAILVTIFVRVSLNSAGEAWRAQGDIGTLGTLDVLGV